MNKGSTLLAIFREFLTSYPKHFILLFLVLLLQGSAAAVSVMALVPLADFIIDPTLAKPSRITEIVIHGLMLLGWHPTFWVLGLFFVVSNALKGWLEISISYSVLRIKYSVLRGLFNDTLYVFFRARWGFFSGSDRGTLLNTLNRELTKIGDTLGHLATLLSQLFQLGIYLAMPIWLNAQLTLTALGLVVLFSLPFTLFQRLSYSLGKRNTETANVSLGILSEVVDSARLILGFGRQKEARQKFLTAFNEHIKVTMQSQVLAATLQRFMQPMALLAIVIALGIAVQQRARVSELAAVMWSLLGALPVLMSLLQGRTTVNNFLPSYEQLVALRKSASEWQEVMGARAFSRLEHGVIFKNLSFTYPGRGQTLTDVSLYVRRGQMTALVGESGSGKSTVTDLVLGLQIPDKGQVLIDDVPLEEWNQNSFRERVGYVPQDPQLFNCSIRDNLRWSFDSASESDFWNALRLANAADFVKELPMGIDTLVGDRGIRLSGGQRQRIALARALVRKPELLILDEATSALDSESERLIQQSMEQVAHDTTILVVAHRLSTIAKADQVYVLSEGRIVEEGSFAILSLKSGGILKGMLAAQQPLQHPPLAVVER